MKLVILALITSSAIAAAQSQANVAPTVDRNIPGFISQAGCPVAFTDVSLTNPGHVMLVKQRTAQNGSLAFQYKNQSGKLIESIEIQVELKVKRSVYDLDAITITRDMTLTGDTEESLPLNMIAYGLGRVTLMQVNYAGGKIWTPTDRSACNYENPRTAEQIGKLQ
jgi:hypothetical protein